MSDPRPGGFVEAIGARAKLAAERLQDQINKQVQASGTPWRYEKVSDKEAVARIISWNDPTNTKAMEAAQKLPERELVAGALDAIKLMERAERKGLLP